MLAKALTDGLSDGEKNTVVAVLEQANEKFARINLDERIARIKKG